VSALQEDKMASINWMTRAGLTGNEIRIALGYDKLPIDNMNVPLMSAGLQRVDEIGMIPDAGITEAAMKMLKLPDYRGNGENKEKNKSVLIK
jgi:hypothetical protein